MFGVGKFNHNADLMTRDRDCLGAGPPLTDDGSEGICLYGADLEMGVFSRVKVSGYEGDPSLYALNSNLKGCEFYDISRGSFESCDLSESTIHGMKEFHALNCALDDSTVLGDFPEGKGVTPPIRILSCSVQGMSFDSIRAESLALHPTGLSHRLSFRGAEVQHLFLRHCAGKGMSFGRAKISSGEIRDCHFYGGSFTGAFFERMSWYQVSFKGLTFENVNFGESNFMAVEFEDCTFRNCIMGGVDFDVTARGSRFQGGTLPDVRKKEGFELCTFQEVTFT